MPRVLGKSRNRADFVSDQLTDKFFVAYSNQFDDQQPLSFLIIQWPVRPAVACTLRTLDGHYPLTTINIWRTLPVGCPCPLILDDP